MSSNYTKQEKKQEVAANFFASCLLMPADLFISEYKKVEHLIEEERVRVLAKVFEVPEWAVVQRIAQLKYEIF